MKIIAISTETGSTPRELEGFYASMEAAVRHFSPRLLEIAKECYDTEDIEDYASELFDIVCDALNAAKLAADDKVLMSIRLVEFNKAIKAINDYGDWGSDDYIRVESGDVLE